jgi:hypothetical protein
MESCWGLDGGSVGASCEMVGGADVVMGVGAVGGADATSASPSRRGVLGGVSDGCRWMGDVFCRALSEGKEGAIEAEGEASLFRARGSESLEDVEIAFHEKWSLF